MGDKWEGLKVVGDILSFTCLYTHQKTTKRKIWKDGFLTATLHFGFLRLDLFPSIAGEGIINVPKKHIKAIDDTEIPFPFLLPDRIDAPLIGEQVEFPKHFVTIEEVIIRKDANSSSTTVTTGVSTTGPIQTEERSSVANNHTCCTDNDMSRRRTAAPRVQLHSVIGCNKLKTTTSSGKHTSSVLTTTPHGVSSSQSAGGGCGSLPVATRPFSAPRLIPAVYYYSCFYGTSSSRLKKGLLIAHATGNLLRLTLHALDTHHNNKRKAGAMTMPFQTESSYSPSQLFKISTVLAVSETGLTSKMNSAHLKGLQIEVEGLLVTVIDVISSLVGLHSLNSETVEVDISFPSTDNIQGGQVMLTADKKLTTSLTNNYSKPHHPWKRHLFRSTMTRWNLDHHTWNHGCELNCRIACNLQESMGCLLVDVHRYSCGDKNPYDLLPPHFQHDCFPPDHLSQTAHSLQLYPPVFLASFSKRYQLTNQSHHVCESTIGEPFHKTLNRVDYSIQIDGKHPDVMMTSGPNAQEDITQNALGTVPPTCHSSDIAPTERNSEDKVIISVLNKPTPGHDPAEIPSNKSFADLATVKQAHRTEAVHDANMANAEDLPSFIQPLTMHSSNNTTSRCFSGSPGPTSFPLGRGLKTVQAGGKGLKGKQIKSKRVAPFSQHSIAVFWRDLLSCFSVRHSPKHYLHKTAFFDALPLSISLNPSDRNHLSDRSSAQVLDEQEMKLNGFNPLSSTSLYAFYFTHHIARAQIQDAITQLLKGGLSCYYFQYFKNKHNYPLSNTNTILTNCTEIKHTMVRELQGAGELMQPKLSPLDEAGVIHLEGVQLIVIVRDLPGTRDKEPVVDNDTEDRIRLTLVFHHAKEKRGISEWRKQLQKGDVWALAVYDEDWLDASHLLLVRSHWKGTHPLRDELEVVPVPTTTILDSLGAAAKTQEGQSCGVVKSHLVTSNERNDRFYMTSRYQKRCGGSCGEWRYKLHLNNVMRIGSFNLEFTLMETLRQLAQAPCQLLKDNAGKRAKSSPDSTASASDRYRSTEDVFGYVTQWTGLKSVELPSGDLQLKVDGKAAMLMVPDVSNTFRLNDQQQFVLEALPGWFTYKQPRKKSSTSKPSLASTRPTLLTPLVGSDSQVQERGDTRTVGSAQDCGVSSGSAKPLSSVTSPHSVTLFTDDDDCLVTAVQNQLRAATPCNSTDINKIAAEVPETVEESPSLILVHGVFGSGKSSLLAASVLLLCRVMEAGGSTQRVLFVSATNVAVDGVLRKLLGVGFTDFVRIGRLSEIHPDVLRYSTTSSTRARDNIGFEVEGFLKDALKQCSSADTRRTAEYRRLLDECSQGRFPLQSVVWKKKRLISCTCATACGSDVVQRLTNRCPIVLVDEAAQQTEPLTVCTLLRFQAKRCLLLGDPMQLPPTVRASRSPLRVSLFERLLMWRSKVLLTDHSSRLQIPIPQQTTDSPNPYCRNFYGSSKTTDIMNFPQHAVINSMPTRSIPPLSLLTKAALKSGDTEPQQTTPSPLGVAWACSKPVLRVLCHQYRCPPIISNLVNALFYRGISITTESSSRRDPLLKLPVRIVNNDRLEKTIILGSSKVLHLPLQLIRKAKSVFLLPMPRTGLEHEWLFLLGEHRQLSSMEGATHQSGMKQYPSTNCCLTTCSLACILVKDYGDQHRDHRVGTSMANLVEVRIVCYLLKLLAGSIVVTDYDDHSAKICPDPTESSKNPSTNLRGNDGFHTIVGGTKAHPSVVEPPLKDCCNNHRKGTVVTTVGIICFYRAQVELIKSELTKVQIMMTLSGSSNASDRSLEQGRIFATRPLIDLIDVEVSTVDAFQGAEKDIIILSCVRTNPEQSSVFRRRRGTSSDHMHPGTINNDEEDIFSSCPRRICVALTRCRSQLIIIGPEGFLRRPAGDRAAPIWEQIMTSAQVVMQWTAGPFRQPSYLTPLQSISSSSSSSLFPSV